MQGRGHAAAQVPAACPIWPGSNKEQVRAKGHGMHGLASGRRCSPAAAAQARTAMQPKCMHGRAALGLRAHVGAGGESACFVGPACRQGSAIWAMALQGLGLGLESL